MLDIAKSAPTGECAMDWTKSRRVLPARKRLGGRSLPAVIKTINVEGEEVPHRKLLSLRAAPLGAAGADQHKPDRPKTCMSKMH